ncbi:heterokaryon incompatibility protein-domain-containing protein [Diaporthe sp. PMI_573]|nr:heterokaryon incompatibility protein-domain-containing protein [Diaporthaceae sp. PMI_573]
MVLASRRNVSVSFKGICTDHEGEQLCGETGQATARRIPGCRGMASDWTGCKLSVADDSDHLTIQFELGPTRWTKQLAKMDGKVWCNLQEIQVLRWIAEDGDNPEAAALVNSLSVKHLPRSRYPCIFPHLATEAHQVLEIVLNMRGDGIRRLGNEAVRNHSVLLCPARASICGGSHRVRKQVLRLAAAWPVRQTLSYDPVEGMIDITPVATCRDTPENGPCVFSLTRGASAACEQRRSIRTHKTVGDLVRILDQLSTSPRKLALHKSWLSGIDNVTQTTVLACRHRKSTVHPTRLYDTKSSTVVDGLGVSHYLALSYAWNEWSNEVSLRQTISSLSQRLGIRYFWVDRWCIDQNSEDDKAREIPRMRDYYRGASACVVLVGPHAKRFGCVPQQAGVILSASQQLRLNKDGLRSVFSSHWSSRVWTMQEALMSRQTIYAVQGQLIDGDFISELLAYAEWAHNGTTRICGCYRWDPMLPVVVEPLHIRMQKGELVIIRSIFGGNHQYAELSSRNGMVLMSFEEALAMSAGRSATIAEDYVYGVLGISFGGERVTVEYGKGQPLDWRKMLSKLTDAGMITDRQLAAPSVNKDPGMSWMPSVEGSPYGPFLAGERIAAQIPRPPLSWSEKGATVMAAKFDWVDVIKSDDGGGIDSYIENINNMPCHRVLGSIRVDEMLLDVAGTSSGAEFTSQRLEGTHMMLYGIAGNQAIAMRVSGDVHGGQVQREDGYVLELFLPSDRLRSLRGQRILVGSVE